MEPASESVPAAIYSYLRAQEAVKGLDEKCVFTRTLQLAISFGGDTDTIGTMAGAIAGAKVGESAIPSWMKARCDGVEYAVKLADKLYDIVEERKD